MAIPILTRWASSANTRSTIARQAARTGGRLRGSRSSHPVQLAVELIASVAQGYPGDDGAYLDHTGDDIIRRYVDFANQNGLIVILDVQIGWSTIHDEVELCAVAGAAQRAPGHRSRVLNRP